MKRRRQNHGRQRRYQIGEETRLYSWRAVYARCVKILVAEGAILVTEPLVLAVAEHLISRRCVTQNEVRAILDSDPIAISLRKMMVRTGIAKSQSEFLRQREAN